MNEGGPKQPTGPKQEGISRRKLLRGAMAALGVGALSNGALTNKTFGQEVLTQENRDTLAIKETKFISELDGRSEELTNSIKRRIETLRELEKKTKEIRAKIVQINKALTHAVDGDLAYSVTQDINNFLNSLDGLVKMRSDFFALIKTADVLYNYSTSEEFERGKKAFEELLRIPPNSIAEAWRFAYVSMNASVAIILRQIKDQGSPNEIEWRISRYRNLILIDANLAAVAAKILDVYQEFVILSADINDLLVLRNTDDMHKLINIWDEDIKPAMTNLLDATIFKID